INVLGLRQAITQSFLGCLRNILPFLLYGLAMFAFFLLAVTPLGLGLLVYIPVALAAMYASYRDVFAIAPQDLP
ncbi:MAG: BPSS1780 family membrane protein, partial [Gammaproteobacteria bacterium]